MCEGWCGVSEMVWCVRDDVVCQGWCGVSGIGGVCPYIKCVMSYFVIFPAADQMRQMAQQMSFQGPGMAKQNFVQLFQVWKHGWKLGGEGHCVYHEKWAPPPGPAYGPLLLVLLMGPSPWSCLWAPPPGSAYGPLPLVLLMFLHC